MGLRYHHASRGPLKSGGALARPNKTKGAPAEEHLTFCDHFDLITVEITRVAVLVDLLNVYGIQASDTVFSFK
jgi:hypothetical protein